MGYPSSIVSWANVAASGVVLRAEHVRATWTELEGIEAEVGVDPHGTAGSLAERLSMAMDDAGNLIGRVAWAEATDTQRRRVRSGYREFVTQTSGADIETFVAGIIFDPPFVNTPVLFLTIQRLVTTTSPAFATWNSTLTVNGADVVIQFNNNQKTVAGVPFGIHWLAAELTLDSSNAGL